MERSEGVVDAEAWVMLVLIGTGILGSLAYLVIFVPKSALSSLPTRPVWMVLLDGGINGRDRPDDPDNGHVRIPPRVPPQDWRKSVRTSDARRQQNLCPKRETGHLCKSTRDPSPREGRPG
jgi:hypothetical protein